MTDRTALAPPLGGRLTEAARSLDVPAGDLDAVLVRGGHRQRRRRRVLAGLGAVALVTGGVGAVDVLGGDGPEVSVSSGGGLLRGDVGIVWRTVSPKSGLGFASGSESGTTTPLYALSTAAGQADVGAALQQRVVWRSDDGVEWSAVSALAPDLYLSDLATRDDRVYAVGTGPLTASVAGGSVSPLLVGWSDDGAATWQRETLPLDLPALAGRTTRVGVSATAVAVGPAGTVVSAVLSGTLDVPAVLPAGVTAPHGWALTASGVDLLGLDRKAACPEGTSLPAEHYGGPVQATTVAPPAKELMAEQQVGEGGPAEVMPTDCIRDDGLGSVQIPPQDVRGVVASYTWDQLHVDGDLLRAVRRQPVAFLAAPGSDRFERVDLPAIDAVQGLLLDADDQGFDLVANTVGSIEAKVAWAPAIVALHSPDGRSWASSPVAPQARLWAAAMGRVGGVATVVGQGEGGAALLRGDGSGGWTDAPLAGALADGVPEGAEMYVQSAAIGPFGIVAAVQVVDTGADPRRYVREHHVLVSRDGITWEDHPVSELAGRPVRAVLRATVVGERAAVAVSVVAKDGDRPEQVVLLGTPG